MSALVKAYRAGVRAARGSRDHDEALHAYSVRHGHDRVIEHAWQNGWNDSPFNDSHAIDCPLGVANPNGHSECER